MIEIIIFVAGLAIAIVLGMIHDVIVDLVEAVNKLQKTLDKK